MLADASESIARAKRPATRQEIERIVLEIVETRLAEGQLDASRLTLNDLRTIKDSFVSSLQGIFHPRIAYPALPPTTAQETAALPPESSATLPPPTQHNQTAGEI
jgi:membrane-associated HD superfamily phosphohydrolase